MEQGFDFSSILKVLVLVAVAVSYIFKQGNKGAKTPPLGQESGDDGQAEAPTTLRRLLEMLGEQEDEQEDEFEDKFEDEQRVPAPVPTPVPTPASRVQTSTRRAVASQPNVPQNQRAEESIASSEIGDDTQGLGMTAEGFDLRQAVIMSEILKRKFED